MDHNDKKKLKKNKDLKNTILIYIVPAFVAIIVILSFIFIIYPTYNNINTYNNEIVSYNSKNLTLNNEIDSLKYYASKKESQVLSGYLSQLNQVIPNNLQFALTSGEIQNIGTNSGLSFQNLSTQEIPKSFNQQNISVKGLSPNINSEVVFSSFNGSFSQVQNYINSLYSKKILFVVSEFGYSGNLIGNYSSVNGNSLNINVTFFSGPDSNNNSYVSNINNLARLKKYLSNLK
jgi:hypothetical protein